MADTQVRLQCYRFTLSKCCLQLAANSVHIVSLPVNRENTSKDLKRRVNVTVWVIELCHYLAFSWLWPNRIMDWLKCLLCFLRSSSQAISQCTLYIQCIQSVLLFNLPMQYDKLGHCIPLDDSLSILWYYNIVMWVSIHWFPVNIDWIDRIY